MREGIVLGTVTSTIKHRCLKGRKLLIVQILNAQGNPEGRPEIVPDFTCAGKGDRVILSWDGIYITEVYDDPLVPMRAWIGGIIDETGDR